MSSVTSLPVISLLFQSYLDPSPTPIFGHKRYWISSDGLRPGLWGFREYSLQSAMDYTGLFEFDETGGYWDRFYEEWVPINPQLAEEVWLYGIERDFDTEISSRDSDFLDFRYRVLKAFGSFMK